MKIIAPNPVRNAPTVKKKSGVSSASDAFASLLSGEVDAATSETAETTETAAASPLDSLLFAQEMPDDEIHWKKAIQHGRVTLEALDQLRNAFLTGNVPISMLRRLTSLVGSDRPLISDQKLQSILDDIELRAAVELAKLEVSGAKS